MLIDVTNHAQYRNGKIKNLYFTFREMHIRSRRGGEEVIERNVKRRCWKS